MSGVKEECGVFGIYDLDGGNVKELTMIVEVHGTGFWTRVRFPPGPLRLNMSNSVCDIIVYRNTFCLVYRRK